MNSLYTVMRGLIGLALGFYFRRIERFHAECVPATGPVLFVSNHPSSLNDSFVIGASVGRKVNFLATVQLFRFPPLKWLLLHCGVIPVNRFKDDPRAMRSVMDTFEAVFRVLERGEAVGIFPEGITHDDPQLKEVKSGAARMALEFEHRHGGKLGLQLVPVGLTFSAKEIYRSEALVNFGEPIRVAEFLAGYEAERKECIRRLTHEIETRIQNLIRNLRRLGAAMRNTTILVRAPLAARRLLRLRSELIAEIESLRPEIQSRLQPSPNP
jgi:glycerol-3-phosphate O-acyltransferase/dihydroxyacetone phosphate acyltransferase